MNSMNNSMNDSPKRSSDKTLDTATESGSLYYSQEKIYPREVSGFFQNIRHITGFIALGIYFLLPWVSWNDRQAILFDLPHRQFYLGPWVFWPQDFYYLTWLLVISAFGLFLVSALAGRIWCGYACPQTVWTDLFIRIERWIEGSVAKQKKLAASTFSMEKVTKRILKHALWILIAAVTGITFVGYFIPIKTLLSQITAFELAGWSTFWIGFYTLATYGNAGFMREQVCKYMCPYARFQAVMLDKDSLVIAYDPKRGEPRGKLKKMANNEANTGCIDCKLCVQVCPTGIDIRDGLQYECIACAACVDVCDSVMEKINAPKGLIAYTTLNQVEGNKTRIIRPRVLVYTGLILALVMGLSLSLAYRNPYNLDIIRDRNVLVRQNTDGSISNLYTLKISNKTQENRTFFINATPIDTNQDITFDLSKKQTPLIKAGEVASMNINVSLQTDSSKQNQLVIPLTFTLTPEDDPEKWAESKTNFLLKQ